MRLLTIFIFAASLSAGTPVAQTITLSAENVPLKKVFSVIEKQTGFFVLANRDILSAARPVTVSVTKLPLTDFLALVLKDQPISARFEGKTIVLGRKATAIAPLAEPLDNAAPPIVILVKDQRGQPLSGASIANMNTGITGSTNEEGMLELALSVGDVVRVSYVGFEARKITVKDNTGSPLTITLSPLPEEMEEVVINKGYYSESRKLSTSNVGRVSAKEIERQPVSNPLAALVGRVPGLDVIQESGLPGTGFTLRLRGLNNVRPEANNPLIIVDGTPYPSGTFDNPAGNSADNASNRELLGYVSASPLNSINPADIESIEVLKDADATSIYGSRGGNGVILITTKKGKAGKTAVNINLSSGIAEIAKKVDVLDRRQYLDMRYEAIKNDGQTIATATASTTYDLTQWDTTRSTDWQDVLLGGTAQYTRAQLSLSGGNNNTSFLFSGNYSRETTIFPIDLANTRYNGRLTVNHQSDNRKFQTQFSINYGHDKNTLPSNSIASYALSLPPVAPPLYDSSGKINWGPNSTFQNPMARLKEVYDGNITSMVSSATAAYEIFEGFKIKASLGYNQVQNDAFSKRGEEFFDPIEWVSRGKFLRSTRHLKLMTAIWNAEPQLEYETMLGPGKLSVLTGATFQQSTTNGLVLEVNNYPDEALMGNTNFGQVDYSYTQNSEYLYNAVFARANYNINSRYILNLTARRDGSSRFAPGKRFGNFAAAGAAWIFTEEAFFQKALPFLNFGKLRGSYGTTGNDGIPDYGYLALYEAANLYAGSLSLTPSGLFNNQYSWETNKKAELGLDLAFLEEKLVVSASYYRNRSSNQLVSYALPSIVGFTSVQSNLPAIVQNTGLELELNSVNIRKKHFSWTSSFNISFPRNKLVSYPDLAGSPYAYTYVEGQPLSIVKAYDRVRVDPETGLNVWHSPTRGFDTSTASLLSITDRILAINVAKEVFGGINNTFQFKQFDLSLFFNFGKQTGASTYSNLFANRGRALNMPVDIYERRWQEKGDQTDIQRLSNNPNSLANRSIVGTGWDEGYYTNITFARLKNIALSYSLPQHVISKMGIGTCRFYVQGQNILTFTNYRGWDPENQSTNYPLLRVWTVGIQLNF